MLNCTGSEKEKFLEFKKLKLWKDPSTFANMLWIGSQDFHFISKCRKYRESSSAQTTTAVLTPKVPPTTNANPLRTVSLETYRQCSPPFTRHYDSLTFRAIRKDFLKRQTYKKTAFINE